MSNDLKFYINGEWVQSDSNELIDVINPANEEVIGQVTAGTKEDIDDAVTEEVNEGDEIAKALGDKKVAILQNHGILTTGPSVDIALIFYYEYY